MDHAYPPDTLRLRPTPRVSRLHDMKRLLLLVCLLSLAFSMLVLAWPTSAASAPKSGVWVSSITPSPQYALNHRLYAVQQLLGCKEKCTKLMHSADGGASWRPLPSKGWSGTELLVVELSGEDVLVSMGNEGIQVSADGGLSFDTFRSPTGQLDALATSDEALGALISGDGRQYLLNFPDGELHELAGSDLQSARLSFHPSWPRVPAGQPTAFASGIHPSTGFPVLQRCDASFSCSRSTVIDTKMGLAHLFVSPGFARDQTIFAVHSRGGLLRSSDGGDSFHPVLVAPRGSRQLISTVQTMAFSRDFDAATMRGAAYAGLVSVSGKLGRTGKVTGGVYRSRDGGISWAKLGPESDLDHGATAVAVAGDRVLAAPLGAFDKPVARILCLVEAASWAPSCPSTEEVKSEIAEDSPATSKKGDRSAGVSRKSDERSRRRSRSTDSERELRHAAPLENEASNFSVRAIIASFILLCGIFIAFLRFMASRE